MREKLPIIKLCLGFLCILALLVQFGADQAWAAYPESIDPPNNSQFIYETYQWTNPIIYGAQSQEKAYAGSQLAYSTQTVYSLTEYKSELTRQLTMRSINFAIHYVGDGQNLDLQAIYDDVLSQDDYLNNSLQSIQWSNKYSSTYANVEYIASYWTTLDQENFVDQEVTRILGEIITPGMTDDEKEKAIHDYIVKNVAYDEALVEHSAYAALARGTTVCQGYALLAFKMLQEAGIQNRIVNGYAGDNLPANPGDQYRHAWNLVKLGDQWYHLDVTHDDPVPDEADVVHYNNYNLSDAVISVNHRWNPREGNYPAASANYYQVLSSSLEQYPEKAAGINQLIRGLELHYLSAQYTANNLSEFRDIVVRSLQNRDTSLTLRTWASVVAELNLSDIFQWAPELGLKTFSHSAAPYEGYNRSTDNTDILYSFDFNYDKTVQNLTPSHDNYEIPVNQNIALAVQATFSNNSSADVTNNAVYTSSVTAVASVNVNGLVKAISPGETNILITYGGQSTSVKVIVPWDNSFNGTELPEQANIDLNYSWTIQFSQAVSLNTIDDTSIYICNKYGQKVDTNVGIKDGSAGKAVSVHLEQGQYTAKSVYYLYVTQQVKSLNGQALPRPWRLKFTTI